MRLQARGTSIGCGRRCIPSAAIAVFLLASLTFAQTYSYLDANGVRTYTNIPPTRPVQDLTVTGAPPRPNLPTPNAAGGQASVDSIIEKYAREYKLDPELIRSMIRAESNFNPKAVSHKGAQGLMQLMPATAARLGVDNPFDPEQNIRGGAQHMRSLLDTFNNDLKLSLAAYNAGENLVQRIQRVPDYRETHNYVRQITQRYGKNELSAPGIPEPQKPLLFQWVDKDGVLHLTNIPPVVSSNARQFSLFAGQGTPE
jgi:hypothetical protein